MPDLPYLPFALPLLVAGLASGWVTATKLVPVPVAGATTGAGAGLAGVVVAGLADIGACRGTCGAIGSVRGAGGGGCL